MYVYDSNWDGSDWATDGEWLQHGDSSVQLLVAAPAVNDAQAIIIALMEEYENVLNGDNLHRYFISTDSWIENSGNEDSADDENIDMHEQKWPIEIACFGIKNRLPSGTMHVILQLHFILTRTHSILFNFLDEGGLPMLPPLPTSSPFSAFDNVAATIIRYIPEVPHLVQRSPKKLILVWRLVTAKRSWSQRM